MAGLTHEKIDEMEKQATEALENLLKRQKQDADAIRLLLTNIRILRVCMAIPTEGQHV